MKSNLTKVRTFLLALFAMLVLGVSSVQAQTFTYEVKGDSVANSTDFYFTIWISATSGTITDYRYSQFGIWISDAFINGSVSSVTFISTDIPELSGFAAVAKTPTAEGSPPVGDQGDTTVIDMDSQDWPISMCPGGTLTTTPVRWGQFKVTRSGSGTWGCVPNKLGFYTGLTGGNKFSTEFNIYTVCSGSNRALPDSDGTFINSHLNNQSPVVTAQPQGAFSCGGSGTAQFSVTAENVNPGSSSGLTYQWLENGIALSEAGVYSGTRTSTLTLTSPSSELNGNSYSCVVTQCGSTTSAGAILTVGAADAPVIAGITQPACGVNTASVSLSDLPSTGSWTVYPTPNDVSPVSGSGSTTTISGLTASSNYTFTVTSSLGCSSGSSLNAAINGTLTVPGAPTVGTVTQPYCGTPTASVALSGLPSGSWTVTPSSGSTGTGSGTTGTISGLAASNTYTFTVTNSDGCTSVASSGSAVVNASLPVPTAPTVGTITQPSCGTLTGSVVLNGLPTTGTGAWTVTPSPNDVSPSGGTGTSATISGLTGGITYSFKVTNSDGCTSGSSGNAVINASKITPSAPVIGTITQAVCGTTSGSVALSGLPSSGNWTINPSPSGSNVAGTGSTYTYSGLSANGSSYTFTVKNTDGCTSVASAGALLNLYPTVPGVPSVYSVTQPVCGTITGSVVLHSLPTGAWTVTTSPGGGTSGSGTTLTVSGLAASNSYVFTVTLTSDGCTSSPSSNAVINNALTVPSAPVVGTVTEPNCSVQTGSIELSGLPSSGTWTVTPSYGSPVSGTATDTTLSGLADGNITFTVTNSPDGCTSAASTNTDLFNAGSPAAPTVGTITQPTCVTATASVALSGLPSSGSWTVTPSPSGSPAIGSGTTGTVSGLAAGTTYTFIVANSTGCISGSSGNAVVNAAKTVPSAPIVGTVTQPTCATQSGSVALSGLPSGSWTVTPSSGLISTGSGTTGTITGLNINTTFTFTVTNSQGCTSGSSSGHAVIGGALTAPAQPTVYNAIQPDCAIPTGTIIFNTQSGVNYGVQSPAYNGDVAVYGASASVSGLPAGVYTLSVANSSDPNCISYAGSSYTIVASLGAPPAPSVLVTQPTCATPTGTIKLNGEGSVKYEVYEMGVDSTKSTSNTFSGLAVGSYIPIITRTADTTCIYTGSPVTLTTAGTLTPAAPAITLTQDVDCSHPTATITVTNPIDTLGYILSSSPTDTNYTGVFSGQGGKTYTVAAIYLTLSGCSSSSSNSVSTSLPTGTTPVVSVTPSVDTICSGTRTNFVPSSSIAGTAFTWTETVSNGTVTGPVTGHGTVVNQLINNVGTTTATVTYTIIGTRSGCSASAIATAYVYAKATAVTSPSPDYICTGNTTGITISGDANTTFAWTVTAGANLSGTYANCTTPSTCGTFINDEVYNSGTVNATLLYSITAWRNGCAGNITKESVVVRPIPTAYLYSTNSPVCSAAKTDVVIEGHTGGTTYSYTAGPIINPAGGVITGYLDGTGATIRQYLINPGTDVGTVFYTITPVYYGCYGNPIQVSVDVNPVATGFANQTSADTLLPGGTTNIVMQYSKVDNTTFAYIPKDNIYITGTDTCADPSHSGICGTVISNTLYDIAPSNQVETYYITPWAYGCAGTRFTHAVLVRPVPSAHEFNYTICSGGKTKVVLSSVPGGSTFAYTASVIAPSGGTITGYSNGTGTSGSYIVQVLTNTGTTIGAVVYSLVPTYYGSVGAAYNDTVYVNPVALGSASPASVGVCGNGSSSTGITLVPTLGGLDTYFTWTTLKNNYVFGSSACTGTGCGTTINDQLTTDEPSEVKVYVITPWTAGCAGLAFQENVTVISNTSTPATPIINGPVTLICPSPQTYTYTVTNPAAYSTVNWTLPAGATYSGYTLNSNPITISFPNTYVAPNTPNDSVTATLSSLCGVTGKAASLRPSPTGGVSISGTPAGLCGLTGQVFSVANFPGHGYSWTATTGITITSGATTNSITADFDPAFGTGTITCDITGCGADQPFSVGVSGAPGVPGTISGQATHCASAGPFTYSVAAVLGATSYIWTLPTGGSATSLTTTTPSISVTYASSFTGNITVKAANSCGTGGVRTEKITVNCRDAGSPDVVPSADNDVVAYPNPAHDLLNVLFNSNTTSNYVIRLIDITGRIVMSEVNPAQEGTNLLQIDLSNYAKGIYNLSITTDKVSKQIRITVE